MPKASDATNIWSLLGPQPPVVEQNIPLNQAAPLLLTSGVGVDNTAAVAVVITAADGVTPFLAQGNLQVWVLPPGATSPSQWTPVVGDIQAVTSGGVRLGFPSDTLGVTGGRYAVRASGMGGPSAMAISYTVQGN